MNLNVVEVSELLQIPKNKVVKLADGYQIPNYKINGQYSFSLSELIEWTLINHNYIYSNLIHYALKEFNMNIVSLFERGTIHYDIQNSGNLKEYDNILKFASIPGSARIPDIEKSLKVKNSLTIASLKTNYGALHPRNPLFCFHKEESISILNFKNNFTIDDTRKSSINTIFINFNANAARHLLCRLIISYLCQSIDMALFLEQKKGKEDLITLITQIIKK